MGRRAREPRGQRPPAPRHPGPLASAREPPARPHPGPAPGAPRGFPGRRPPTPPERRWPPVLRKLLVLRLPRPGPPPERELLPGPALLPGREWLPGWERLPRPAQPLDRARPRGP